MGFLLILAPERQDKSCIPLLGTLLGCRGVGGEAAAALCPGYGCSMLGPSHGTGQQCWYPTATLLHCLCRCSASRRVPAQTVPDSQGSPPVPKGPLNVTVLKSQRF